MTVRADQAEPRPPAGLDPYGAATHEVANQPVELADYNLFDSRRGAEGGGLARGRRLGREQPVRFRRPRRLGRIPRTRRARQPLLARTRHPRPLRPPRRPRALPSRLSRADARLDRGGPARVSVDRPAGGRACGPRRTLLHAHRSRGRPPLPDHHDLRLDRLPRRRARACRAMAAEDPRPRLRSAQRPGRAEAGPDDRHGDDREAGRLGRARQYDARHSHRRRGGAASPTNSSATNTSSRRRCATPSSCSPRRRAGSPRFLAPRWRPDGTKNPLQIIRLKRKMGNVSNASSETELRGALGWHGRAGGPGRSPTIIEMVAHDPLRLHDRLVGRNAHGGRAGDRPLPAAQGVRRLPHRPADHDRRARRPRDRIRGGAGADDAHRARARPSRRSARGRARAPRRGDRQILDLQARRPATPTRRWNASAARA